MGRPAIHLPLVAVVGLSLVAGLWAALLRIGWSIPAPNATLTGLHGQIMGAGVMGTLLTLERAVALATVSGRRLHPAYLAPALGAAGTIGIVLAGPVVPAQGLLVAGAAGLLLINLVMLRSHPELHVLVMTVGAAFALLGNAAWLAGWPILVAVHWWMAFLVLTIVGERLELSRIRVLERSAVALFALAAGGYVAAELVVAVAPEPGVRLVGAAMLALAGWLLRYDIAWLTIRRPGLPSFVAVCLLAGYGWLAVGGLAAIVGGAATYGPAYDITLHAVLLGFVFSMIFGHAPIIFPAILGLPIRYHPALYLPLAILHASVAARVVGGLAPDPDMTMRAGLLNVVAIALYAVVIVAVNLASRVPRWAAARS